MVKPGGGRAGGIVIRLMIILMLVIGVGRHVMELFELMGV